MMSNSGKVDIIIYGKRNQCSIETIRACVNCYPRRYNMLLRLVDSLQTLESFSNGHFPSQ